MVNAAAQVESSFKAFHANSTQASMVASLRGLSPGKLIQLQGELKLQMELPAARYSSLKKSTYQIEINKRKIAVTELGEFALFSVDGREVRYEPTYSTFAKLQSLRRWSEANVVDATNADETSEPSPKSKLEPLGPADRLALLGILEILLHDRCLRLSPDSADQWAACTHQLLRPSFELLLPRSLGRYSRISEIRCPTATAETGSAKGLVQLKFKNHMSGELELNLVSNRSLQIVRKPLASTAKSESLTAAARDHNSIQIFRFMTFFGKLCASLDQNRAATLITEVKSHVF